MFYRVTQLRGFQATIYAIFCGFVVVGATDEIVPGIDNISCEFNASTCGWRPFRGTSSYWEISNSTQNDEVQDNGGNFLMLLWSGTVAKVGMMISPHVMTPTECVHFRFHVFCLGSPKFELRLSLGPSGFPREILADIDCPKNNSWTQIKKTVDMEEDVEVSGIEEKISQVVLYGSVEPGEIIAIQDLQFIDNSTSVTSVIPISSSTEADSTTSNSHNSTTQDLPYETSITPPSTETDSTSSNFNTTTQNLPDETSVSSVSTVNDSESTASNTVFPLSTENTSTVESNGSTTSNVQDYTSTISVFTKNNNLSSTENFENRTNATSASPQTTTFSSESDPENHTSITVTSTINDNTQSSTVDSKGRIVVIASDEFMWRTVFISTLTAFFVFSVFSILVSVIRKLMRRRKQWSLARNSRSTTIADEGREVISLTVLNKT